MMKRIKWMIWVVILLSSGIAKAQIAPGIVVLRPIINPTFQILRATDAASGSNYANYRTVPNLWPLHGNITPNLVMVDRLVITTAETNITIVKWALGNQPASYFLSNGTDITSTGVSGVYFSDVISNQTYTVYMKNSSGGATVKTIQISNMRDGSTPLLPYLLLPYPIAANYDSSVPGTGAFTLNYMQPPAKWSSNFELYDDIDLNANPAKPSLTDNWTPIGYYNSQYDYGGFSGSLYGNHHKIQNLTINKAEMIGFFVTAGGTTASNPASIQALGLTNVSLTGTFAGAIVGMTGSYLTINDCYTTGSIFVTNGYTGGILGLCWSGNVIITKSYSTCDITSRNGGYVGGISGGDAGNGHWEISECYTTGIISMKGPGVGGIAGTFNTGSLDNCYSTGSISGVSDAGGIVGDTHGNITNCFSTATVSASGGAAGGIVGTLYDNIDVMSGCVALNRSINGTPAGALEGASGGIVDNSNWVYDQVMINNTSVKLPPYTYNLWNYSSATTLASYTNTPLNWDPAIWIMKTSAEIATSGIDANLPILNNLNHLPQPPYIAPCLGGVTRVDLASSASHEAAGNFVVLTATVTPTNAATPITYSWEVYDNASQSWNNMDVTTVNYVNSPILAVGPNNYRVTASNLCSSAVGTISVTGDPPPQGGSAARIAWNPVSGRYVVTFDPNDAGLYFKFGSVIGIFSGTGGTDYTTLSITPNPNNGALFNPSQDVAWTPNSTPITDWTSVNFTHLPNTTIDATYHTAANVKLGLGDPCRLIGLDLNYIKNTMTASEPDRSKYDNGTWMTPTQQQNHDFTGYSAPIVSNGGAVCDWWWDATGTTSGSVGRPVNISPFAGVPGAEFTGAPNIPGVRGSGSVTPQRAAKFLPAVGRRSGYGTVEQQGVDEAYFWSDNSDSSGQGLFLNPAAYNMTFAIQAVMPIACAVRCVRYAAP